MSDVARKALNGQVKLNISVIGVGFAGSYNAQIIHERLGIPAFVINSSVKDLSESVINKEIPSFVIGTDGRGAGNDRAKSLQMFKSNGKELMTTYEPFVKMIDDSDIVFIVFSSAGGTGSGTGPMLTKLCREKYREQTENAGKTKHFIPIVISPKANDDSLCQYNNLECINELDSYEGPYVIGDLEEFASDNENVAYEKMSEWVVETVQKLSGMDLETSQAGMMDENDLSVVLSAPGYMAQYTVEITNKAIEHADIQDILLKKISKSPAMLIQKDKNVSWGGLIVNLPDDVNDPVKTGDLNKLLSVVGEPKHVYKNHSVSRSTKGSVTLILSGLSLPYNRLAESKEKVKRYIELSTKSQRNISLAQDLAELGGGFSGFSSATTAEPVNTALDDFFG